MSVCLSVCLSVSVILYLYDVSVVCVCGRTSKMSCVAVLLLVFKPSLPAYVREGLFAIIVIGFVSIKVIFFLRGVDLLSYPEKHLSYLLFGGLVDDLEIWIIRMNQQDEQQQQQQQQR